MMATICPETASRLAKVLGMLGSAHDGEIAAAGRLASSIVRDAGLTWHQVICPDQPKPKWAEPSSPQEAAEICLEWPHILSEWEREFLASVLCRLTLTQKQQAALDNIIRKVRVAAKAAT